VSRINRNRCQPSSGTPTNINRNPKVNDQAEQYSPVPDGLELDHLCHTNDSSCPGGRTCPHRPCVNPFHLDAVPPSVNTLRGNGPSALNSRKTHCKNGHEFTPQNTRITRKGHRWCRACDRARDARGRRRKSAHWSEGDLAKITRTADRVVSTAHDTLDRLTPTVGIEAPGIGVAK
jgi:hypothetical protein